MGPPTFLFSGDRLSFPGVKRLGREANRSSPSSAEVKNEWSHTSAPPVCFHGVICIVMVAHCHTLTFYLIQIRFRLGSGSVDLIVGSVFNFRLFRITCQNVSARSQSCLNLLFASLYEGHLESKERFAIKKYLLIIGKKKNMQVLSHTFTYFST